jgi:hypothetical protein
MRQQQRRESARGWIASGAAATIKTYARRYARRPLHRPRKTATGTSPLDTHWIMMDGRPYFVAGYTSGGVPYGIFEDEMHDLDLDHDHNGLPSLPDDGLCEPDDDGRTETSRPSETTLRDEASHPAPSKWRQFRMAAIARQRSRCSAEEEAWPVRSSGPRRTWHGRMRSRSDLRQEILATWSATAMSSPDGSPETSSTPS